MKHQRSFCEIFWSRIRRFLKNKSGQVTVLFALTLPAMVGIGALAVDGGQLFVARSIMQNAADAGARAGTAVLAEGGTQSEAAAAAANFANQNMVSVSILAGATPAVTFPTAESVQVSINHNVPLVLAPSLGFNTANVATGATAQLAGARSIEPGHVVPLAIYCNNAGGCAGALAVGQTMTLRRYCGNYFADGPSGNACGSAIADAEIFMAGITFDDNNSDCAFRDAVEDGYGEAVAMGQQARALPGNHNGWRSGMTNRLSAGDNELVLPVIREAANPNGNYNVEIVDFVKVRISSFATSGSSDQTTLEIIQSQVSTLDFADTGEGLDINSITGVRLSG